MRFEEIIDDWQRKVAPYHYSMKGMEGAINGAHYSCTVLRLRKPETKEILITVLLADDQIMVRNLIQLLLERADEIPIVTLASNKQEAVEKAVLHCPNVVIMDGVEATRQICEIVQKLVS